MNEFEFIAILLSIIFGLALTNLLSGMLRAFFMKELDDTRLAWSMTIGMVLLINWWGFFRWSDNEQWQFAEFLLLVLWATSHYLLAVSIYPYDFLDHYTEALRRKFLLSAMLAIVVIDVGETIMRGELFTPWYYLIFIGYLATVVIVTMLIRTPMAMRISGWLLFGSILTWSAAVRNILSS